jgi:hypothetical protein
MTQINATRAANATEKTAADLTSTVLDAVVGHGQHALERSHDVLVDRSQELINRGAKARKQTRKAAKKAAKKASKRSAAVWADFADEAAQRASNVVAAGKGSRFKQHRKTPWILGGLALAVGGLVTVSKRLSLGTATPSVADSVIPTDIAADSALRRG